MHFNAEERRVIRRLSTPERIGDFIDEIPYNKEPDGPTCRSPRGVLRDRLAHCMEGALLAAAALEALGYPPLIVDLEAVRDDDHVLAVYRVGGSWGSIAKSNYAGLRHRAPVYRTVRELVMSYFEHYYNLDGEKTLRAYSRPVSLRRFDRIHWRTAAEVWDVPNHLVVIRHTPVLPAALSARRFRIDRRLYQAGLTGMQK
jgi:hypothetical protein